MLVGGTLATYLICPGCLDRDRVNRSCEWTGDAAFTIDPRDESHRRHLVADAQLAEELAIRHGDAEFGRRFGVEHHGGLIDNGRFRRECLSRMFDAITTHHDVTSEQIQHARGQRNGAFDLSVGLLFLPIYSFGAVVACRRLSRRFTDDARVVRHIATGLCGVAFSVLGVQSFRLYGAVWESIRVGNGHMTSMRAASYTRWSQDYIGADFIGAAVLFLCIAWYCSLFDIKWCGIK